MNNKKTVNSKYVRSYGKTVIELASDLGVSTNSIITWHNSGEDIYAKAKNTHCFTGNKRLLQCWSNIRQRCEYKKGKKYKFYGGKGIVNNLSKIDLLYLWERDRACKMKQPSIDRIDSNKNYSLENCRFIEMREKLTA